MNASTAVSCTVAVQAFRTAPFGLDWGASIFAKLVAINIYDDSLESAEANGALITTFPDPPTNLLEVYSERSKSTLGIEWTAPVFTGGVAVDDYQISLGEVGGDYAVIASGVTATQYTATDLTFGVTYKLRMEARNSYSFSVYSEEIELYCGFKPEPPTVVSTTNVADEVMLAWNAPVDNGATVTAYRIFIVQHDGVTYSEETVQCVGTDPTLVSTRECVVPLTLLRAAPYSLVLDDEIYIKIISINSFGESEYSTPGNNAKLQLVPDKPILSNDDTVTSGTEIGLTWVEGASNGGTAVIDFKLWYKHNDDVDFVLLEEALTTRSYTTSVILQPNNIY
jgi:hypothetical protein